MADDNGPDTTGDDGHDVPLPGTRTGIILLLLLIVGSWIGAFLFYLTN